MHYDLIIRDGLVVDGTTATRRVADVGIIGGKVRDVGRLSGHSADKVIEAAGLVVAPGLLDFHTHFDGQINWDPYLTSACWHGITSVVGGNCGFGYAPCKPSDRERIMGMMENSEQIPIASQRAGIKWTWESFPEWMETLRNLPKAMNIGMFLPMNALLVYVMGEDAKTRPATEAERAQMRDLLHEAMDAGATGFSFSLMGNGNGHVDFDGTPVPTDLMDPEEAYNLARVLFERDEGVIQCLVESRMECRREISETLARISRRPVIHNSIQVLSEPTGENVTPEAVQMAGRWREALEWVERLEEEGLDVYLQAATFRVWIELRIEDSTLFMNVPVLHDFQVAKSDAKLAMIRDPEFRRAARDAYKPEYFLTIGGGCEKYTLVNAHGAERFSKYEGKKLSEIAEVEGSNVVDIFFDILDVTDLAADFKLTESRSLDVDLMAQAVRHRRVIPGTSDGGAHGKMFTGAHWATDMLMWHVKEAKTFSLEEMHHILSRRTAAAYGVTDRGLLMPGFAADIVVYDLEALTHAWDYTTVHDLPGGEWRRISPPAPGMRYILVNGEVTVQDGVPTGALSGQLIRKAPVGEARPTESGHRVAAE